MTIEKVGSNYIEVLDEDGLRNLVRITAIQRIANVDEMSEEAYLFVAGRTILVRASLDEFRKLLDMPVKGASDTSSMTMAEFGS